MEWESPKGGSGNNEYVREFNKSEGDKKSNGMGIEKPHGGLNDFEGSLLAERDAKLSREVARFEELRSKAFGTDKTITNAGIVLDSFGGSFGE